MRTPGRDISLGGLLATPRPVAIEGGVPSRLITDDLRALAAICDPVADAHAGWLIACLAAAGSVRMDRIGNDGGGRLWTLTPGGRAWLIATAIDLIKDERAITDAQPALARAWRRAR